MMRPVSALLLGLAAFCAVPAIAAVKTTTGHPTDAAMSAPESLGDLDAPVSIVIFTDLECPFSAATFPIVQQLVKSDPAHIHLAVKEFPLSIHANAELAAEAAEAAGAQGQYFAMANLIQANQKRMSREQYVHYAELLQLDRAKFIRDLDQHRYAKKVRSDRAEGLALGVNVTPTLLINGQTYTGTQSAQTLNVAVHKGLAAAVETDPIPTAAPAVDMAELVKNPTAARGPVNAPVTIVEFTDFQCPFCRRASEPLAQLLAQSGTPVRYVFRNFPLDFHEHAEQAAEAVLAAGAQGKFWPMHDLLFANQKDLSRNNLINLAGQLHLDMARFTRDLDSGKYTAQVAADRELGVAANVDGTPAFFINGHRIDGAMSLPELNQAVALAQSRATDGEIAGSRTTAAGVSQTATVVAGQKNAPVTLVWFSNIQTATAKQMGQLIRQLAGDSVTDTVSKSNATGSSDSQVRVLFKFYGLPDHSAAPLAHLALVSAAAQGKFWQLYDAITSQQFSGDAVKDRASILAAAQSAGLDTTRIDAAMNAGLDAQEIHADTAEAEWRGIRGVPTLYINQFRVDGLQSPALYSAYIQKALADSHSSGN